MQIKPKSKTNTKKPFQWGISSTTIDFMRTSELEAARDGSSSDCSKVSSLPAPKRKATRRTASKD